MNCIVLGVTGGIAAYKAVDLARQLVLRGFEVKTIMTEHATRLIGPATFRAITGNPVARSMFADEGEPMQHISLAREADLIIVAPATANIIAKMANGLADDLLSTMLLATRAPIMVAPAMNLEMWRHAATRANLEVLRTRGVRIVGPESGFLACGEEGEGRMTEPDLILEAALDILGITASMEGRTVLVTAGGTREPIDPVRYIGNRSSGKMGYALAAAARRMGARVILVSGPTYLQAPQGVEVIAVETAEEMWREVMAREEDCDVVIMAAAVADFSPQARKSEKIKKDGREGLTLECRPTRDILRDLGQKNRPERVLVGFAAETGKPVENAVHKLHAKGADMIVANDVSTLGSGFDSDFNKATMVYGDGRVIDLDLMPKIELAARIWDAVIALLEAGETR
ncbi:MAG: bifunctional phosphopantothenoylcysteine decarboxylase/phosphopantothenate--cysteine ligase CoaBC [Actinobacteria bacterium]|nr:MAG: bifunctional phosphopantothenoylcysteine decarboxylase/phosphopantothenate--cysteine ligase CoaBC [Actinomycetota bacterium]